MPSDREDEGKWKGRWKKARRGEGLLQACTPITILECLACCTVSKLPAELRGRVNRIPAMSCCNALVSNGDSPSSRSRDRFHVGEEQGTNSKQSAKTDGVCSCYTVSWPSKQKDQKLQRQR